MGRLVLLLMLLPLAACESPSQRALEKSPDFKAGYSDGCASAVGSVRRDDDAYRTDTAYRTGWGSGMGACRIAQPGTASLPDKGIGLDPGVGAPAKPF